MNKIIAFLCCFLNLNLIGMSCEIDGSFVSSKPATNYIEQLRNSSCNQVLLDCINGKDVDKRDVTSDIKNKAKRLYDLCIKQADQNLNDLDILNIAKSILEILKIETNFCHHDYDINAELEALNKRINNVSEMQKFLNMEGFPEDSEDDPEMFSD